MVDLDPCDLHSHLPVLLVTMNQLPSDSPGYVTGADRAKLNQMLDEFDVELYCKPQKEEFVMNDIKGFSEKK